MNKAAITSRLEQQCSSALLTLLDDMFASCDDLFFDLASRATSNTEQNLYFESMREIRVRKANARIAYQQSVAALFKNTGQLHDSKTPASASTDDLSIVDKDLVELDVAITAMSTRARAVSKSALHELGSRLSVLYDTVISEQDTPLDPLFLSQGFSSAIESMEIDIKASIILLKQYERYVLNRLPELYQKTNKLLNDNGIEYRDKGKIKKQASNRRDAADASQFDEPLLEAGFDGAYQYAAPQLADLSTILASLRGNPQYYSQLPLPLFSAGTGTALDNRELLQLLESNPVPAPTGNTAFDMRAYLQQLLSKGQPEGEARGLQQVDEDVINLVAMFFDFVLDDKNIPDNIKALVSRLQMPILKIALRDKSFFSNTDHPAREFINEIARVSIGLDDSDGSAGELIEQIEQWVQEIQINAQADETAFVSALDKLRAFSEKHEKRAELVTRRTREAAQGQARKEIALVKAQRAIQEAMDGKSVAVPISEFIVQHWQQALYATHVKEGEEGQLWLAQLQTMQNLIWSAQSHTDKKSRQRLDRIREEMFEKLREGLAGTTLTEPEIGEQLERLRTTLGQLNEPEAQGEPRNVPVETFQADQTDSFQELQKRKGWKEMTALERQKVQYQALTFEFIERAEAVSVGSWVEFKQAATGTILRCKLAAKLETSDSYVFVNRLGFKALEIPRKEFAYDLQRKKARLLRAGPLFERSLHKMVSSLKKISA